MTAPMEGGRRRIDHVLAEDFLAGLSTAPLAEVRDKRHEAEQEEADLSYVRRLLQGRMDIVEAEQARRRDPSSTGHVVDRLAEILADDRGGAHGMGRHLSVEPSRVDEHRRRVEKIVADAGISDVEARTDDELSAALDRLGEFEREVSENRRRVQTVMDGCSAEIARRYRDGEASVDELLSSHESGGQPG